MTRCTFFPAGWLGARREPAGGRRCGLAAALAWSVLAAVGSVAAAGETAVDTALRERVERLQAGDRAVDGVTLLGGDVLAEFYARRAFRPAWGDPARVEELITMLETADGHGLDPADFFSGLLRERQEPAGGDPRAQADRELLLTEALIRYGYQRRFGKVDPSSQEPAWNFARSFAPGTDAATALEHTVSAPSLRGHLDTVLAESALYRALRESLARFRAIEDRGGWPQVPAGATLRAGDRGERVTALRERLSLEPVSPAARPESAADLFDDALTQVVRAFQERHGLTADGAVGRGTLAALNVPVGSRIDQLRMSLERLRWLTRGVPETYVVVNVAAFDAGFVRDRRLVWTSRVVVGRAARQTPIFRGEMTYLELNPTWTVPPTILREDTLPKVRRDPGYLRRENITVLDRSGRAVDPQSVDWSASGFAARYALRQEPGPANALGRIKFMFPNPHAVYLHDTPARELFGRQDRSFSSGCIRVEDPLALAELVLDSPQWTRATLEAAIAGGATQRITLAKPVPVLIVYLTAVAGADGVTRFFRDVYGRDPALLRALNGPVRLKLPAAASAAGPAAPSKTGITSFVAAAHTGTIAASVTAASRAAPAASGEHES
ncbi:MAG: L,D-transpeptidase family protein [Gammaproteobacteria bacterium]|nr:MAG: L,D-transpeptidase family protein [Gammaproteobacteria bacterium]